VLFPYLSADSELKHWKAIGIERDTTNKKKIFSNKGGHHGLYGWHALPKDSRQLILCEGEIDCLTLAMAKLPVLSVPNGCQSHQWIDNEWERLEQFDDIVLALDGDEHGEKAMAQIVTRLGRHRCRVVNWSEWGSKDPNALHQMDLGLEVIKAIISEAKTFDPDVLKSVSAYQDEVIDRIINGPKNDGLSLPWPLLDNNFRIRESELTIVTGRNGSGKSQMVGQIMHHLMTQEQRVCIASMEMPPATTLHRMVQQMNGHSEINKQQVQQSFEWLTNKLWMVNVVGSVKADELLEVFEYAHRRYGINQFVIDSLMRCGIREDDWSGQNEFVQKLCDFKLKTKAHVWLVSHPRKGESENQAPTKLDVRGASAITDNADNVLSLWRNPNKRESLNGMEATNNNEPDATITIGKQRNGDGWEGKCFLWFNPVSKRFTDEPLPVDCLSIGHNKGRGPFKARAS
jgi:twinkle protein